MEFKQRRDRERYEMAKRATNEKDEARGWKRVAANDLRQTSRAVNCAPGFSSIRCVTWTQPPWLVFSTRTRKKTLPIRSRAPPADNDDDSYDSARSAQRPSADRRRMAKLLGTMSC